MHVRTPVLPQVGVLVDDVLATLAAGRHNNAGDVLEEPLDVEVEPVGAHPTQGGGPAPGPHAQPVSAWARVGRDMTDAERSKLGSGSITVVRAGTSAGTAVSRAVAALTGGVPGAAAAAAAGAGALADLLPGSVSPSMSMQADVLRAMEAYVVRLFDEGLWCGALVWSFVVGCAVGSGGRAWWGVLGWPLVVRLLFAWQPLVEALHR
jgi:hypothetical protein